MVTGVVMGVAATGTSAVAQQVILLQAVLGRKCAHEKRIRLPGREAVNLEACGALVAFPHLGVDAAALRRRQHLVVAPSALYAIGSHARATLLPVRTVAFKFAGGSVCVLASLAACR